MQGQVAYTMKWHRIVVNAYPLLALQVAKKWDDHQFELRGEWIHDPAFTEWSLLFIYGMHSDKFFKYHAAGRLLQGNEVWHEEAWDTWNPCKGQADKKTKGYFSLVQSRMEKHPDEILKKLKQCWKSL